MKILNLALFSNYLAAALNIFLPILAIPFYVKYLGFSGWGEISALLLIQSFVLLCESSVGQSLVREFAVAKLSNETYSVFKKVENIYILSSVAILLLGLVIIALLNRILGWTYNFSFGACLVLFGASFQLSAAAYKGALIGIGEQVRLNISTCFFLVFRTLFGVLSLYFYSEINVFLLVYLLASVFEFFVRKKICYLVIPKKNHQQALFPRKALSGALVILLGVLSAQLDKFILGGMLSSVDFGKYAIASSVAIGLSQVIYPLLQYVSPRLSIAYKNNRAYEINRFLFRCVFFVSMIVIFGYFVFGNVLLKVWLGEAYHEVKEILDFLIIGTVINFFYNIGYTNWVASGCFRQMFRANVLSLAITVIFVPGFVTYFGIKGAGMGWVLTNSICFLFSLGWVKR